MILGTTSGKLCFCNLFWYPKCIYSDPVWLRLICSSLIRFIESLKTITMVLNCISFSLLHSWMSQRFPHWARARICCQAWFSALFAVSRCEGAGIRVHGSVEYDVPCPPILIWSVMAILIWHFMIRGHTPFLIPLCCGTDVGRVATFCLPSPLAGAGYDMTYVSVHVLYVLKICIWHSGFSTQFSVIRYDFTSVIPLYIFSTYFVLTPFLRGLRFYAAQVQTTDLPIRTSRILLLLFWALFSAEPILLVQSNTFVWICTLFWVWRGPVPSYDYVMFCRGLWIYLCGFCTYVWVISFYHGLLGLCVPSLSFCKFL